MSMQPYDGGGLPAVPDDEPDEPWDDGGDPVGPNDRGPGRPFPGYGPPSRPGGDAGGGPAIRRCPCSEDPRCPSHAEPRRGGLLAWVLGR